MSSKNTSSNTASNTGSKPVSKPVPAPPVSRAEQLRLQLERAAARVRSEHEAAAVEKQKRELAATMAAKAEAEKVAQTAKALAEKAAAKAVKDAAIAKADAAKAMKAAEAEVARAAAAKKTEAEQARRLQAAATTQRSQQLPVSAPRKVAQPVLQSTVVLGMSASDVRDGLLALGRGQASMSTMEICLQRAQMRRDAAVLGQRPTAAAPRVTKSLMERVKAELATALRNPMTGGDAEKFRAAHMGFVRPDWMPLAWFRGECDGMLGEYNPPKIFTAGFDGPQLDGIARSTKVGSTVVLADCWEDGVWVPCAFLVSMTPDGILDDSIARHFQSHGSMGRIGALSDDPRVSMVCGRFSEPSGSGQRLLDPTAHLLSANLIDTVAMLHTGPMPRNGEHFYIGHVDELTDFVVRLLGVLGVSGKSASVVAGLANEYIMTHPKERDAAYLPVTTESCQVLRYLESIGHAKAGRRMDTLSRDAMGVLMRGACTSVLELLPKVQDMESERVARSLIGSNQLTLMDLLATYLEPILLAATFPDQLRTFPLFKHRPISRREVAAARFEDVFAQVRKLVSDDRDTTHGEKTLCTVYVDNVASGVARADVMDSSDPLNEGEEAISSSDDEYARNVDVMKKAKPKAKPKGGAKAKPRSGPAKRPVFDSDSDEDMPLARLVKPAPAEPMEVEPSDAAQDRLVSLQADAIVQQMAAATIVLSDEPSDSLRQNAGFVVTSLVECCPELAPYLRHVDPSDPDGEPLPVAFNVTASFNALQQLEGLGDAFQTPEDTRSVMGYIEAANMRWMYKADPSLIVPENAGLLHLGNAAAVDVARAKQERLAERARDAKGNTCATVLTSCAYFLTGSVQHLSKIAGRLVDRLRVDRDALLSDDAPRMSVLKRKREDTTADDNHDEKRPKLAAGAVEALVATLEAAEPCRPVTRSLIGSNQLTRLCVLDPSMEIDDEAEPVAPSDDQATSVVADIVRDILTCVEYSIASDDMSYNSASDDDYQMDEQSDDESDGSDSGASSLSDSDFEPESDDALEYDSSDDDESVEEDDAMERELQSGKESLLNCPHVMELYTELSDGLKAVGGSPGERQFLERLSATCGWIAQFELVGTRHPYMVEVLVAYFDQLDDEEDLEVMGCLSGLAELDPESLPKDPVLLFLWMLSRRKVGYYVPPDGSVFDTVGDRLPAWLRAELFPVGK